MSKRVSGQCYQARTTAAAGGGVVCTCEGIAAVKRVGVWHAASWLKHNHVAPPGNLVHICCC
jgi:hypothetical protein